MEKKYVCYEDFGAKGDGVHDDMPAIVAAHNYANEQGLPVRATDGACYYIGGGALTATIKTSTDFGKAKFTIDDRELENINVQCFNVASDFENFTPDIKELRKGQTKLDFPHEGHVFVKLTTDTGNVYIRKGLNKNGGSAPSDSFIVDPDGNILNGISWDYPRVTSAVARCVDDEPIVISGGIFTTIANRCPSKYTYHARGFSITRSHVVVKELTHYVEGELDHGAPYTGFLSVGQCYDVTLRDCLLTPHKTYYTESQIPGQMVGMGTYDLGFGFSIGVKLINIKQTIDILNTSYWGLMGSNFCKDMLLENCTISRFDAHCGVTGLVVRGCELGFAGFNLIGFNDCLIEDTTIHANSFINLRADYGSFFDGNVTIRNCKLVTRHAGSACVIAGQNEGDHDFGYKCMMPHKISVDGLTIDDATLAPESTVSFFNDYDKTYTPDKPFPYGTPEELRLKGVTVLSGRKLALAPNPAEFENTRVICAD